MKDIWSKMVQFGVEFRQCALTINAANFGRAGLGVCTYD